MGKKPLLGVAKRCEPSHLRLPLITLYQSPSPLTRKDIDVSFKLEAAWGCKSISSGEVVSTDERLTWPRTIGVGLQHIAAMFGATFLVPIITGFPPTTTLFFSGIGTLLFLVITKNRVPSYLGSSFAFLAPIAGAMGEIGRAHV